MLHWSCWLAMSLCWKYYIIRSNNNKNNWQLSDNNKTIGSSVQIKSLQLCFRFFDFYQFATKSIQNNQNLFFFRQTLHTISRTTLSNSSVSCSQPVNKASSHKSYFLRLLTQLSKLPSLAPARVKFIFLPKKRIYRV